MSETRDSILYSSLRSFFKGFFWIAGLFIALFLFLMILGGLVGGTSSTSSTLEQSSSIKILPDENGVRTSSSTAPVLLHLNVDGIIGADNLTMQKVRSLLTESREGELKGDRVKGILLYINSPGGTVSDADGIYRALKEYKARYHVPIIAYTEGLCASGGMYVACAADKIYSCNAALVGSIGVLFPTFLNFSQLMEKVGVQSLSITAGKGKDVLNPLRPWQPGEDTSIRFLSTDFYHYFVEVVTSNRPQVNKTKLVDDYGAQIFPATLAKEYGLIDEAGYNESGALKILAKEAGIEGQTYQVIELESKSLWEQLFTAESPILTGTVKHEIQWDGELDKALQGQFLYLYRPEKAK